MFVERQVPIELPFEVGKMYTTKFQTRDSFTITRILYRAKTEIITGFEGIYEKYPDLGACPLGADRLYPEIVFETKKFEVCDNCGREI